MLEGIGAGFVAIAGGVERAPVARRLAQIFKWLKYKSREIR
jgi:hypothetical protein